MDCDEARRTAPLNVGSTDGVPRRFRGDHDNVEVSTRRNLTVMNIEPMGERDRRTMFEVRFDLVAIDLGDGFIWHQHHDEIGLADGLGHRRGLEACLFDFAPRRTVLAHTDHNINT